MSTYRCYLERGEIEDRLKISIDKVNELEAKIREEKEIVDSIQNERQKYKAEMKGQ